jgi:hypothetical protein
MEGLGGWNLVQLGSLSLTFCHQNPWVSVMAVTLGRQWQASGVVAYSG